MWPLNARHTGRQATTTVDQSPYGAHVGRRATTGPRGRPQIRSGDHKSARVEMWTGVAGQNQFIGSTAWPLTITVKWRWQPVDQPVEPS